MFAFAHHRNVALTYYIIGFLCTLKTITTKPLLIASEESTTCPSFMFFTFLLSINSFHSVTMFNLVFIPPHHILGPVGKYKYQNLY